MRFCSLVFASFPSLIKADSNSASLPQGMFVARKKAEVAFKTLSFLA